jgi:hypothetical protein
MFRSKPPITVNTSTTKTLIFLYFGLRRVVVRIEFEISSIVLVLGSRFLVTDIGIYTSVLPSVMTSYPTSTTAR